MAAQGVYNGLAEVGKIKATIGLVVAVCVALSCCASGGMTLADKHTAQATASVSNVNCASMTNPCYAPASYTVSFYFFYAKIRQYRYSILFVCIITYNSIYMSNFG